MIKQTISVYDIKDYFYKHKQGFILFLICFLLGIVIGLLLAVQNDFHLNLLNSSDEVLYKIINGSYNFSTLFWVNLKRFIAPIIIIFILGLNYYSSLFSFVYITFQSALLLLSSVALVSVYEFSGTMILIFFMLPVNLIYFSAIIVFAVHIFYRSKYAKLYKYFAYDYKSSRFWTSIGIVVLVMLLLAVIVSVICPIILKNVIFIIF